MIFSSKMTIPSTLLSVGVAFALSLCAIQRVSAESGELSEIQFDRDIRPLLSEYCFACHGPDSGTRAADLRLDRRDDAMAAGVIVPGKATDSELIKRITSSDPELVMPPPESSKKLEPEHKRLLSQWIESGAHWEEHWAFVPLQKPELPSLGQSASLARNQIDRFVFRKIEKLGVSPGEQADRYTLARRAALDVTGLPPLWESIQSFVADTHPGAYERYLDTLLSSAHAGEHRARYWLDAARYGDTHGMHVDNYREIWPYRDWVVRAFNSNMPFDQFTIQQIAGDLLPDSTLDQRIATGFNRCHVTTAEGGSIPEEVNVRYTVDRVETTSTVFLGLTTGCAVCHNHKFDPITQREFYELSAFFNNTTQRAMDGNQKDTPPVVTLPAAKFKEEWSRLQTRRDELRSKLDPSLNRTPTAWWPEQGEALKQHPVATDGLILWLPLAESEGEATELPEGAQWATGHPAGRRGIRFGEKAGLSVAPLKVKTDDPLTISFWYRRPDRIINTAILEQLKTVPGEGEEDEVNLGWKIFSHHTGGLSFDIWDGKGNVSRNFLSEEDPIKPGIWQHVCVRYSGGQSSSSISILLDGRAGLLRPASAGRIESVEMPDTPLEVAHNSPTASLSDVRMFRRWLTDEEVRLLAREHTLRALLGSNSSWDDLPSPDRAHLISFYNNVIDDSYRVRSRELSDSQRRRDFIYARSTTTLIMQERPSAPRAWVLERGEYDQRREEVSPNVPGVLPALPGDAPRNRLGLAQWLVQPDHPLTARVLVNRLWQSIFGVGLVKTSEDFGVMGDRPSHPELLDWLAVEFVESGWNLRHVLKLILSSATYRQSTVVTGEKLEKDPQNRFLTRGPRVRLDAEVLRDQALAVSGLLERKLEGPGVRPYQPSGLWKVVAIQGSNTQDFKQDSGDALYRRSLYTFWKRTSPPPSMAAFDAPTREQCTVRRERTNTPLQALVLMNDPQYVEAARYLAQTALTLHTDERARASMLLAEVLGRPPSETDLADVLSGALEFHKIFKDRPEDAARLIETGDSTPLESCDKVELAAWTLVANTLLNRDDFINKN